jgi:hypothetical protein
VYVRKDTRVSDVTLTRTNAAQIRVNMAVLVSIGSVCTNVAVRLATVVSIPRQRLSHLLHISYISYPVSCIGPSGHSHVAVGTGHNRVYILFSGC